MLVNKTFQKSKYNHWIPFGGYIIDNNTVTDIIVILAIFNITIAFDFILIVTADEIVWFFTVMFCNFFFYFFQ